MKKILLFAVLLTLSFSCVDYLEPAKDGSLSENDVWSNTRRSFGLLNNAYNNLIDNYNRISNAMLAAGCDEAVHADPTNRIKGFNDGTWSRYNLIENVWDNCFEGIRKTNLFLENANNIVLPKKDSNLGTDESIIRTIDRMKGEAKFLRAYFYFELVRRYGGVPIIDKVLNQEEAAQLERQSADSCFHFIFNDCDSAIVKLPSAYNSTIAGFNDSKDQGRATSWAAKALKARAQLYYASPLFNTSGELSRWKDAYLTAEDIIKKGIFGLPAFSASGNMTNLFVPNAVLPLYNKEIIFTTQYSVNTSVEHLNAPISFGGYGLTCPTQNLVDAFGMRNGKAIDAAASGYDPANPYQNRDPRLKMTVLKNGDLLNINDRSNLVEIYKGGRDAPESSPNATPTGYYLAKYVVQGDNSTTPTAAWESRTVNTSKTKVLFRLAEIMLIYAEAYNEYHSQPNDDVYIYLENIMKRSGVLLSGGALPDMSKEKMRAFIRNERRVELAFEEHRFFDIRRWKLMDDANERQKILKIEGIRIEKKQDETFSYERVQVQNRIWDDKMYFYPIPQYEINKATKLKQNEGWEK